MGEGGHEIETGGLSLCGVKRLCRTLYGFGIVHGRMFDSLAEEHKC
jgi:hypothetical protein